jgi:riboflavin-specific deaminase-like protein
MEFRRLLPEPATLDLRELLDSLEPAQTPPADRPYVLVNFVASADGRATFQGRSGALGDDGDNAIFHGLRERVDAVMAGTATMKTERYGRILSKAERRERRSARGESPEPLACVITRSGALPLEIPLFAEPEARLIVFSTVEVDTRAAAAEIEIVQLDPGELTLTTALRHLRADHGIRTLLCEGGPTLFGAMLEEQVVDELFLTIAPKLTGGGNGPTVTSGPELATPRALDPIWLLERKGSLYARYRVYRGDGTTSPG